MFSYLPDAFIGFLTVLCNHAFSCHFSTDALVTLTHTWATYVEGV